MQWHAANNSAVRFRKAASRIGQQLALNMQQ
jgi:hypothetical protein